MEDKEYNKPYFRPPKSLEEFQKRLETCDDPNVLFFDLKNEKARELLIFMEETKIWNELLTDCIDRSGVNAGKACRKLNDIVDERLKYYNSTFNETHRPKLTPGIPVYYESKKEKVNK